MRNGKQCTRWIVSASATGQRRRLADRSLNPTVLMDLVRLKATERMRAAVVFAQSFFDYLPVPLYARRDD